jgi:hypothetical protein
VTVSDPTGRAEYAQVATPPTSVTALHKVVLPYVNVTVPEGVPEPCEVTVAVNNTDCPKAEGFDEEAIVVAEPDCKPSFMKRAVALNVRKKGEA